MTTTLNKILFLLSLDDQKRLWGLVMAIIMMSLLDMLGVASLFPFLNIISRPELIFTSSKLKWLYEVMGFNNKDSFLIALGASSFFLLVVSNILRAVVSKALIRFSWMKHYNISKRLLSQYLYEPYVFFLNRNSAELTTYLMSEVARVISGTLIPFLQLFARLLLIIFVVGLLFFVDPFVVMLVLGVIGTGYLMIYLFFRARLTKTGKELSACSQTMYKALNESFGGIKDIKLMGKEKMFIDQYAKPAKKVIDCYCSQFLITQLPRYAFEAMAFGGILAIMMYLVIFKKDYQGFVPLVGLYALAAYRLMPALQQVFHDVTSIRFNRTALDIIYNDFIQCHDQPNMASQPIEPMPFTKTIELCNVTFQYPKAPRPVIENLSLLLKANTTIGFVGETGAGKTTLIDIILGLLQPQQGVMVIDAIKNVDKDNIRRWQKNLGYVPQHIYLCDDTITRNIAFGVYDHDVDRQAVVRTARLANIHDFIEKELPAGYETRVGERGIRLSGGQRQRIGIARALYHDPAILVFDEATSALDAVTEDAIWEAISRLVYKKTIIIVAHRLSTVKECDIIYFLDKGKIIDHGTYQELLANNQQFRKMAKIPEAAYDRG